MLVNCAISRTSKLVILSTLQSYQLMLKIDPRLRVWNRSKLFLISLDPSFNCEGRLGTTDDFTAGFPHFPLFSTSPRTHLLVVGILRFMSLT